MNFLLLAVASSLFLAQLSPLASALTFDEEVQQAKDILVYTSTDKSPNVVNKPMTVLFRFGSMNYDFNGVGLNVQIRQRGVDKPLFSKLITGTKFGKTYGDVFVPITFTPTETMTYAAVAGINNSSNQMLKWEPNAGFIEVVDSITPEYKQPDTILQSINFGGPDVASWKTDTNTKNGMSAQTPDPVDLSKTPNGTPKEVFKNSKYGNLNYSFDNLFVGKSYKVRLYLNEYYWTAADQRVFNVKVNNNTVLENIDVFKEAGGKNIAITKDITYVTKADGKINLALESVKGNPMLFGVELIGPAASEEKILQSINSGSETDNGSWSKDMNYEGNTVTRSSEIVPNLSSTKKPAPAGVYQSYRAGDMTYKFNGLTPGKRYSVRMHFNESYCNNPGERVFSITTNNNKAMYKKFDILLETGGKNKAITREFNVLASATGSVVVKLASVKGNAMLSGIQLIEPENKPAKITGIFHTEGTKIIDSSGNPYITTGANLGALGNLSNANSGAQASGNSDAAKRWGWNTIRLNILVGDGRLESPVWLNGFQSHIDNIDKIVQDYNSKGIVVMIVAQDSTSGTKNWQYQHDQVNYFWAEIAHKYKNNDKVWFNTMNEPLELEHDWIAIQDRMSKTIRSQGAPNIMLYDAPKWGQDIAGTIPGSIGSFSYAPNYVPSFAAKYGNAVVSQHNYAGNEQYNTPEKFAAYVDKVHGANLPLVVTEIGFTYDKTSVNSLYRANRLGALAAFAAAPSKGVGLMWWSATHQDGKYALQTRTATDANGNSVKKYAAFNEVGDDIELTEGGQRMWNLTHPDNPVVVVPQTF